MKYLAAFLLLICSLSVAAGDSGIYHNPDINGEGILVQRNGDKVVVFLFTHGAEVCGLPIVPLPSPPAPEPQDGCQPLGQRWFFAVNEIVGNVLSGILFISNGIQNSSPVIGDETAVGTYTMVRDGGGWLLAVNRFGPELSTDDPLFAEIFDFSTLLFAADD